jgi:hypothetical protein
MGRVAIPVKSQSGERTLLLASDDQGRVTFILNPVLEQVSDEGMSPCEDIFVLPADAVALVVKDAEVAEALHVQQQMVQAAQRSKLVIPDGPVPPDLLRRTDG